MPHNRLPDMIGSFEDVYDQLQSDQKRDEVRRSRWQTAFLVSAWAAHHRRDLKYGTI